MREIVVIIHNIRSSHNVGSLLRTADGLGIKAVYLTGYTPYPRLPNDTRLPHEAAKIDRQIRKTALGAEHSVTCEHRSAIEPLLAELIAEDYSVVALEQAPQATPLHQFKPPSPVALIVGREVEGLEDEVLAKAHTIIEIPMLGQKESLNVSVAAAIAMYHCRYF